MDEHGKESGNLILTVEASHFRQDLDEKNRKLPDPKRTKAGSKGTVTLWQTYKKLWKITIFEFGKSTISMGHFQ